MKILVSQTKRCYGNTTATRACILEVIHKTIPFFKDIVPKYDYTYSRISHRTSLLCNIDQMVDKK